MSRSTKMPKTAAKEPYCALYPFRAADKQDICLRPGDKLYVFDARDDNWWFVSDLTVVSPFSNTESANRAKKKVRGSKRVTSPPSL